MSSSVGGPAASCAQRGAGGGARCCCYWGFLEDVGRMLMVARAACKGLNRAKWCWGFVRAVHHDRVHSDCKGFLLESG